MNLSIKGKSNRFISYKKLNLQKNKFTTLGLLNQLKTSKFAVSKVFPG